MKNIITNLVVLLSFFILILFSSINLWAGEKKEKPSVSANVAILSKYIWRGFELSDDSVVIQPSTTLEYKDLRINVWGNLDTAFEDDHDNASWNETDFTIAYDRSFGQINASVGYIYYALSSAADSRELYFSLGIDTLLSPTITIYREIAHLPSWYINLGISHSISLPKQITLDISGSAGYYYSDDDDFAEAKDPSGKYRDFHDALISIELAVPIGKYTSITPILLYSFPLSNKADDLITDESFSNDSDFLYGGLNFSVNF